MGRFALKFLLFLSILFFVSITESISQTTTQLINNQLTRSPNLGIYIKNLTTGKIVSRYNSNKKFIPASNQKIVTTLSSLNYLGENFQFNSYFFLIDKKESTFTKSIVKTKGVTRNFYVDTKGDPTFRSSDLKKIVRFFKKRGLKRIEGNIIIENKYFEEPYYNKNWKKSWKGLSWAPHISSIAIDDNLYTVKDSEDLLMTDNPLYLLGIKLLREFKRQNIEVKGKILLSRIPWKAKFKLNKILYKHSSAELHNIVKVINKRSNNLYAEQLFKKLSASFHRTPGSWKSSSKFVSNFLSNKVGLDEKTFYISDGSGLSRKNKITPKSMVTLLEFSKNSNYFDYFYNSLAVGGVDGTLLRRFKSKPLYKNLRAKTGYIKSVSSLSGFFKSKNGDLYAFSIIVNDYNYSIRPFIERLLTKVYYL
tara:strand:- start:11238 stop:12500 length:1263 start_codon:yes stop_codon:yes gene_type:complete